MLYPDFNELVALEAFKSRLNLSSSRPVRSNVSGSYASSFRGQGLEFDSVREYVPGDDIRNIDWRVTARTGAPHLKIFMEERERHIVLCVDMNAGMRFGTRKTFKSVQAARTTSLLGWKGLSQQDRISACLFGDVTNGVQFFPPKRTRSSLLFLLKTLAAEPAQRHTVSLSQALDTIYKKVHTGSLVYVLSDFLEVGKDFEGEMSLARLRRKCDVVFISINDPADRMIPPVGTLGFQGSGSDKTYINTESSIGRKAYADLWEEHEKKLQEITTKFKLPLVKLTTESDLVKELSSSLRRFS